MTEKEFIKSIKSKANKDGTFTYVTIVNLFDEYNSSSLNKMFSKINIPNKTPEKILENNFELIFENLNNEYINAAVSFLLEKAKPVLEENILIALKKIAYSNCMHKNILEGLEKNGLLEKNIDYILEKNPNIQNLYELSQILKGKNEDNDKKINEKIKQNKVEFAKVMLKNRLKLNKKRNGIYVDEEDIEKFSETLAIIIDEVLESEKLDYIDIIKISSGGYSDVYKIGDKILKVSENRETHNIPNHRRILQPILRTRLIKDEKNDISIGCLEVVDRVATIPQREYKKEMLYSLYKELRDDGIVWTDARFANVGKLLKENTPTLGGQKMKVAPNSVGFDRSLTKKENSLKVGDWVILDTDFLYRKESQEKGWSEISYSEDFERKYLKEKKEKEGKLNPKEIDEILKDDDMLLE